MDSQTNTKKDKHMFYLYENNNPKAVHVFSAPNPKRAVEKAVVREHDTVMHNYVVRRDDRDWGKEYQGRREHLDPPVVIKRSGVEINITNVAQDVKQTSDNHIMFDIKRNKPTYGGNVDGESKKNISSNSQAVSRSKQAVSTSKQAVSTST